MRWRFLGIVVAVAALAACATPAGGTGGTQTVTLTAHWSRFRPDRIEVPAGSSVRFIVHNADPVAHELIVGDRATQDRHENGTEAHHGERPGEISVPAGATVETTYRFDRPGTLLFGCHLPGHWAYGMRGTIEVR